MGTNVITRHWPVLTAVFLVFSLAACHRTQPDGNSIRMINGAGSSFGYPIYSRWADGFHEDYPGVRINYQSIGSGAGVRQLLVGTVDFGASDAPMTSEQMAGVKSPILHFPTVVGAAVPFYNIPGVTTGVKFTPGILADIFLGKITKWDDPAIVHVNPGIKLPSANIVVVHRSDGSGTTFIWTDYLSKVSPDWKAKVGSSTAVKWPVGIGEKGSEGVTGFVRQTPDSIGYVELTYAIQNHISYGAVENSSGAFIQASLASVTAAAAAAASSMPADFRVSITDPNGKEAYPISSFTWILVPARIPDHGKREAIKSLLHWMLTKGQNYAEQLGYARLPTNVVAREEAAISEIH